MVASQKKAIAEQDTMLIIEGKLNADSKCFHY